MGQLALRMSGENFCKHAFCHSNHRGCCKLRPSYLLAINVKECLLMKVTGYLDRYKMVICRECYEQDPSTYIVLSKRRRDIVQQHVRATYDILNNH